MKRDINSACTPYNTSIRAAPRGAAWASPLPLRGEALRYRRVGDERRRSRVSRMPGMLCASYVIINERKVDVRWKRISGTNLKLLVVRF